MPRAEANKVYSTLNRGLITEATALSFPENATTDELNCDIFLPGNRKRRLGFDVEPSWSLSSVGIDPTVFSTYAVNTFTWKTVGGNGDTNFGVVQIGSTLYFYDLNTVPLSNGQKSFTVNLASFAAPAVTDTEVSIVTMTSGKGYLFVAGEKIESFYVSYDSGGDTITATQITVQIRDLVGVDDGLANDNEPGTLSTAHHYNLKNQGWVSPGSGVGDPITTYFSAKSVYPPNSKQWFVAKNATDDFDASSLAKFMSGNAEAPKGHFILDAFNQDRDAASGLSGLTDIVTTSRPTSIIFHAGRIWYGGAKENGFNSYVFFSQIIDDVTKAGFCYQLNDPTAEDLNDTLPTDGGYVVIPEIGLIKAMFSMEDSLIVFANNGIWTISGNNESGFSATDFQVKKISSIGTESPQSIVSVEGFPVWWGNNGISAIFGQDEISLKLNITDLSKGTIQTFLDDIPEPAKKLVKGNYDAGTRKIFWLYDDNFKTVSSSNRYRYKKMLVFDARLQAFYPWEIATRSSSPFYIGGMFENPTLTTIYSTEFVVDSSVLVVDNNVQVVDSFTTKSNIRTFLNFFAFNEDDLVKWTFGNFTSRTFTDWFGVDQVGVFYESFFETGDEILADVQRDKASTYIQVLLNRTETAYTDTSYTELVNPSSCYMQAKWEWSDHSNSRKFGPKQQVYRFRRTYTPSSGTGFDTGFPVIVSKNKVRGHGRALRLRFESEAGKDFDIIGWAISYTGETKE